MIGTTAYLIQLRSPLDCGRGRWAGFFAGLVAPRNRFNTCVIWSAWSSYLPFGKLLHSSIKYSTYGAIDGCGR